MMQPGSCRLPIVSSAFPGGRRKVDGAVGGTTWAMLDPARQAKDADLVILAMVQQRIAGLQWRVASHLEDRAIAMELRSSCAVLRQARTRRWEMVLP